MALTDDELNAIADLTGLYSRGIWAGLYALLLQRRVSVEEVDDAHDRLYARYWAAHPAEKAEHDRRVAEFEQMIPTTETFWRGSRP